MQFKGIASHLPSSFSLPTFRKTGLAGKGSLGRILSHCPCVMAISYVHSQKIVLASESGKSKNLPNGLSWGLAVSKAFLNLGFDILGFSGNLCNLSYFPM